MLLSSEPEPEFEPEPLPELSLFWSSSEPLSSELDPEPEPEPVANRFSGSFIDERPAFDDEPEHDMSIFDEPVKPNVSSIEPDEDDLKPEKVEEKVEAKPEPAITTSKASSSPAKSLFDKAAKAVSGRDSSGDDLDVPAFIRRRKK